MFFGIGVANGAHRKGILHDDNAAIVTQLLLNVNVGRGWRTKTRIRQFGATFGVRASARGHYRRTSAGIGAALAKSTSVDYRRGRGDMTWSTCTVGPWRSRSTLSASGRPAGKRQLASASFSQQPPLLPGQGAGLAALVDDTPLCCTSV